ncbi:unnamed protein product, partial [Gulo gulo]
VPRRLTLRLFKHLAPLKVRTWGQNSGCPTLVSKPEPQTRSQKSRVAGLLLPDRPWAALPLRTFIPPKTDSGYRLEVQLPWSRSVFKGGRSHL